jgi:hypothetical protein
MLNLIDDYNKKIASAKLPRGNAPTKGFYQANSLTGSQASLPHH